MNWVMLLKITALGALGVPAILLLMSFVMWKNAFRVLGRGFVIRMSMIYVLVAWSVFFVDFFVGKS